MQDPSFEGFNFSPYLETWIKII